MGERRPAASVASELRLLMVVGPATGGIGAHAASLATGLSSRGWHVTVVTARQTAQRFDLGEHVEVAWPGRAPASGVRAVLRMRTLAREVDVVHAQGHQAGLLALAATALLGRGRPPVVVSWHNAVLGAGLGRRARGLFERLQVARADLVTGASQDLVTREHDLGARHAELAVVAAPGDRSWTGSGTLARAQLADELGVDVRGTWLLTVSRIAPQKNLEVLVAAARRLAARTARGVAVAEQPADASARADRLTWIVVGDGQAELLTWLRARVASDRTNVLFVGARTDVPRWMAAADVFVLPSAWEARALVVQEALAAGLPVVASAVGGLSELIGSAGVLVEPGDADALADAVAALVADPDRRAALALAGRARAADLPDERDVIEEWDERYRRLRLGRRRPRT